LFLRVRDRLSQRQTSVARVMTPAVTTILLGLSILLLIFSLITSPVERSSSSQALVFHLDIGHGIALLGSILALTATMMLNTRRQTHYSVYYGNKNEV